MTPTPDDKTLLPMPDVIYVRRRSDSGKHICAVISTSSRAKDRTKYIRADLAVQGADNDGLTIADYEECLADHRRLVRELDIALNGDGAAKQASLCDIVGQVKAECIKSRGADNADKAAALERIRPLLQELIAARDKATSGQWVNVGPFSGDSATRYEIRQNDTAPTDKYHYPFRLCETISGQTANIDKDNFDFIAMAGNLINEIKNILEGVK